jgi:hypothetical protein
MEEEETFLTPRSFANMLPADSGTSPTQQPVTLDQEPMGKDTNKKRKLDNGEGLGINP